MIKKYLETHLEELIQNKLTLENKKLECDNQIKELNRFIELLEEKNDTSFESFTPREVNPKNKEKIKELQGKCRALQKQVAEIEEKQKESKASIDELTAMLQYMKTEESVQRNKLENVSREKSQQIENITGELEAMIQKLNHSLQFVEVDLTRSKLELQQLVPQLEDVVTKMKALKQGI